ncbi:unnamed protein product [Sphenostylis stenocarpa]|uniref:Uncharacterized protein n=1 Tax=Sphenostylis stenocarpa TaxID=92480 RepID=A0AA86SBA7_9FABA|nr:unnamed protein product [Sphenostylis stenocarpa]
MDSQNASFNAGQAKGQAEEKASSMMDKASNAAQSAQDSMQQRGSQWREGISKVVPFCKRHAYRVSICGGQMDRMRLINEQNDGKHQMPWSTGTGWPQYYYNIMKICEAMHVTLWTKLNHSVGSAQLAQ